MRLPRLWRARMAVTITTMALAAVLVATSAPAAAASASASSEESRLLALTNQLRASVGAPALTFDEPLAAVGMGPDIDTVHRALVASRSHYVNLVDSEVTVVGIGVVTTGRYVFIVENFLQRSGPAATARPAPAPTTTPGRPPATTPPTAAPRASAPPTIGVPEPVAAQATAAPAPVAPPSGDPPSVWLHWPWA